MVDTLHVYKMPSFVYANIWTKPYEPYTPHSCSNYHLCNNDLFFRYRRQENQLNIFADDFSPRWTTASCMVDYRTIAGADKFGNVAVLRLPSEVSDEVDEDPTGVRSLWDRGWLGGSAQKAEIVCATHVGELVVSLQKTALIPGGPEAIVYTTLAGGVGALIPFSTKDEHEFFQHLEMYMRTEHPPLCGRDHLSFRSYYFPVKVRTHLCDFVRIYLYFSL